MFEESSSVFVTNNNVRTLLESLNMDILQHLTALEDKFER